MEYAAERRGGNAGMVNGCEAEAFISGGGWQPRVAVLGGGSLKLKGGTIGEPDD